MFHKPVKILNKLEANGLIEELLQKYGPTKSNTFSVSDRPRVCLRLELPGWAIWRLEKQKIISHRTLYSGGSGGGGNGHPDGGPPPGGPM